MTFDAGNRSVIECGSHHPHRWSAGAKRAFAVFAIVGALFLVVEHRAHVVPLLPWLLLAACPLMHVLMHGGHRGHGRHGGGGHADDADRRGGEQ